MGQRLYHRVVVHRSRHTLAMGAATQRLLCITTTMTPSDRAEDLQLVVHHVSAASVHFHAVDHRRSSPSGGGMTGALLAHRQVTRSAYQPVPDCAPSITRGSSAVVFETSRDTSTSISVRLQNRTKPGKRCVLFPDHSAFCLASLYALAWRHAGPPSLEFAAD